MITYPIATDEHYGWRAGTTESGEQVILSTYQDLYFDSEGKFLRLDFHCDWMDHSPAHRIAFEERSKRLLAAKAPVRIQEFEASETAFLRRIPRSYESRMDDPKISDMDKDFIDRWVDQGDFEFQFNDNYWMKADGTVGSS
ncbi:MAG: hypothetical protein P1U89_18500 [Verrucomicrobiales bacterium]|nr:hypothetical protein [Verrucomicrobiales bacterium]